MPLRPSYSRLEAAFRSCDPRVVGIFADGSTLEGNPRESSPVDRVPGEPSPFGRNTRVGSTRQVSHDLRGGLAGLSQETMLETLRAASWVSDDGVEDRTRSRSSQIDCGRATLLKKVATSPIL